MPNIIAVVQDERARRQIEQYLQQLGMEDLRFATFKSQEEFSGLYFNEIKRQQGKNDQSKKEAVDASEAVKAEGEKKPEAPTEAPADEEKKEDGLGFKLFSPIHMVLFATDSIGGVKIQPYVERLTYNLKKFGCWPEGGVTRMIVLKYEDDGLSKLEVLHPLIDDLIYLPLDRLVFLQKLQIFLTLPKSIKPTFLFSQEVKKDIEISKIAKADRISEVGLAIRNPLPLKKGVLGHFYVQFPGDKVRFELYGKVFRSEPHPDFENQYLVYFTFFGLPKKDLTHIRRTLGKAPNYKGLQQEDREAFRYKSDDPFLEDKDRIEFGVAVVDQDQFGGSSLAQHLGKEVDRLKVVSESSYSLFLHKYFDTSGSQGPSSPPRATEESDFYKNPITLSLATSDLKVMATQPEAQEGDLFLGHSAFEIFSNPEKFIGLIPEKTSRLVLEEAVQFARKGKTVDKLIVLQDFENQRRAINIKLEQNPTNELVVTANIAPASLGQIVDKAHSDEKSKSLEVILVDAAFTPEDPKGWIEGLRLRAVQLGLVKEASQLKFLLMADHDARQSPHWFTTPDILGLLIKPVDMRQLSFLLSEHLGNKNTLYQFDNLFWWSPSFSVHVSKEVHLEALSEFGATLRTTGRIANGTMVYLRKSIYENAPNQCLAARVYACEEHPSEKGFYQVLVTYFGMNDAFLKFARTWIRDNYASSKGQGDS